MKYRTRPYMKHLSDEELKQRAIDVFTNILVMTKEGKVAPRFPDEYANWIMLWTHLLEEFQERFGAYPEGFRDGFIKKAQVPDVRSIEASQAVSRVKSIMAEPDTYLVKFGRALYLRPAYETGRIRIAPASSYADVSLNPAILDNELRRTINPPPEEVRIELRSGSGGPRTTRPLRAEFSVESRTDYHVWCLALALEPRLFLDFRADSCLLIRNPEEFTRRVCEAFAREVGGWSYGYQAVKYMDPLNCSADAMDVFFVKHFRYAYQQEFRIVWVPPQMIERLPEVFLNCGSFADCTELVILGDG